MVQLVSMVKIFHLRPLIQRQSAVHVPYFAASEPPKKHPGVVFASLPLQSAKYVEC